MRHFSVYIHIPFCLKKCHYCDFLSFPKMEDKHEEYIKRLCEEISAGAADYGAVEKKKKSVPDVIVDTVFIGGGTPTLLSISELEKVINCVKSSFTINDGAEFTIEANPETLDAVKLEVLRGLGINRLSMGVQAMDDRLLKILGRAHSCEKFTEVYRLARNAGFDNINLDLMFGLPEQSLADWKRTLEAVVSLEPEHISCYSLTLEDGAGFAKMKGSLILPDEDTEREMYYLAKDILHRNGYVQYEISNFAKPDRECRHNTVYWTLKEYISFGLGAHSFAGGVRYRNTDSLAEYLSGDFSKRDIITLSDNDKYSEFMFLGLRMNRGVSERDFAAAFNVPIRGIFGGKIAELVHRGLLSDDGEIITLTKRGVDLSNMVFSEMLPE